MAFTGKNELLLGVAEKNNNTIDFLTPKKDYIKDSLNDPYKALLTQKNAHQYTLKTLNALKIVSPIIMGLMQAPGVDASNASLSNNFKLLISEISQIAINVCEKLGIDHQKEQNFWIRNVLERNFSEIIHHQWIKHGVINVGSIIDLVDDIVEFADKTMDNFVYDDIHEENLVKLAAVKSMLPILEQAQEKTLYRNLDSDIESIIKKLFDVSKNAVNKIANDYADEKDRAKLFSLIMQEAGKLYAMSWKAEGERVDKIMDKYPKEKLDSVLKKYKSSGGLPLTKVESDFDKYFDKVLVITEKLISSSKGPIKKRLKIK